MNFTNWHRKNRKKILEQHKKSKLDLFDFSRKLYKKTKHYKPIRVVFVGQGKSSGTAEDYNFHRTGKSINKHELYIYGFRKDRKRTKKK